LAFNGQGQVLVGLRKNRPAQGCWFVPGGRIRKNETLDDAFIRLMQEELGSSLPRSQAKLLGVYEHFYDGSVFGDLGEGERTHYVVLGYALSLDVDAGEALPKQQHTAYRWQSPNELLANDDVHAYTKAYFK
jgi:colanic acid biosynthesis protein WcaH